ncbi:xanthine dehydrogenase accessory protein XdhC [Hasllibacter sp. MH4015]|uniref:xanthine dehydrogenase accessory protein XdhC n=1 Tax=Hasllibacter sp. MH4015 TaxID=2854029 RepID=UPI001CD537FD|nr:xanthine dehydrogenase accessory protein XdhC [Hasllibacter sp. MH4015]
MSLASFLAADKRIVQVRLIRVRGSSPREAGAQMFVSADGTIGTIGGGQLEYMATDHARAMLRSGLHSDKMDVPLGSEIGQCCGGRVEISLQRMTSADRATALAEREASDRQSPCVYILGAGHVGRALARQFQHLPVRCSIIDSRGDELALVDAAVEARLSAMAEADIRRAPKGSAFIVLTHDHALDFLLTSEALERGDAAYVGLIGSATKRAKFERYHRASEARSDTRGLVCPIGATGSPDKRPEVIAAFVVAEVMDVLTTRCAHDVIAETTR